MINFSTLKSYLVNIVWLPVKVLLVSFPNNMKLSSFFSLNNRDWQSQYSKLISLIYLLFYIIIKAFIM